APDADWSQAAGPLESFLYDDAARGAVDYRSRMPLIYRSPGDEHLYTRSSWQDDAVWSSFMAGDLVVSGHQVRAAGHVSIQRGNDYLLVNSGQWKGPQGWGGHPSSFDTQSWRTNTLYYPTTWTGGYTGGQGWWGINAVAAFEGTKDYVYEKADVG